jgi:hypothetical protein
MREPEERRLNVPSSSRERRGARRMKQNRDMTIPRDSGKMDFKEVVYERDYTIDSR